MSTSKHDKRSDNFNLYDITDKCLKIQLVTEVF